MLGLCALALSTVCLADDATRAAMFWAQMDSCQANSPEWTDAQRQLTTLIENLPARRKVAVAVAMMNRSAPDAVNRSLAIVAISRLSLRPQFEVLHGIYLTLFVAFGRAGRITSLLSL